MPVFALMAAFNGSVLGGATIALDRAQWLERVPANTFWVCLFGLMFAGVVLSRLWLHHWTIGWTQVPPALITEAYFSLGRRGQEQLVRWQRHGEPVLFRDLRRLKKLDPK